MAIRLRNIKERFQRMEEADKTMLYIVLRTLAITLVIKLLGVSVLRGAPILMDGFFIFTVVCVYVTLFTITFGYGINRICSEMYNKLISL